MIWPLSLLLACVKAPEKSADQKHISQNGAEMFVKYGCAVCHSIEGKVIYGPPLNGIYMKKLKVLRNNQEYTVVADRDYLTKAINEPRYEKVLEYSNKEMPLPTFSKDETSILVDYIIGLDEKIKPNE